MAISALVISDRDYELERPKRVNLVYVKELPQLLHLHSPNTKKHLFYSRLLSCCLVFKKKSIGWDLHTLTCEGEKTRERKKKNTKNKKSASMSLFRSLLCFFFLTDSVFALQDHSSLIPLQDRPPCQCKNRKLETCSYVNMFFYSVPRTSEQATHKQHNRFVCSNNAVHTLEIHAHELIYLFTTGFLGMMLHHW